MPRNLLLWLWAALAAIFSIWTVRAANRTAANIRMHGTAEGLDECGIGRAVRTVRAAEIAFLAALWAGMGVPGLMGVVGLLQPWVGAGDVTDAAIRTWAWACPVGTFVGWCAVAAVVYRFSEFLPGVPESRARRPLGAEERRVVKRWLSWLLGMVTCVWFAVMAYGLWVAVRM